ncbi:YozE family protein [Gracilibacillus marinus]|jgi:uncharacterized protein YozE (UPF0346 family)|uniref:YozE family protein n=1 Tax=Gracilibacillus marinus TaxID=630535 RepID=A0ABV8VTT9_9BACI
MKSFHQYMMRYRGNKHVNNEKKLAEWMFHDHDFPKYSTDYDEISSYLEWNIPFSEAISTFDKCFEQYLEDN